MSKVFIISNTNFNIQKNLSSKEWLKNMNYYFYKEFIPFLTNTVSSNDILIHLGNFLYKSKMIDLNVLKFVQDLFEEISSILPVYIIEGENDSLGLNILKNFKNIEIIKEPRQIELLLDQKFVLFPFSTQIEDIEKFDSDYCFLNIDLNSSKKDIIINKLKKFNKCYNGYYDKNSVTGNIKNLGGPYNINSDDKKGFIVLETHTDKDKFVQNKISPTFKKIVLNSESDLNISQDIFKNNYISLTINKQLLIDNKLKIEMLIAEHDIVNITYSDDEILKDKEDILELGESSLSLKEMVIDYINQSPSENKKRMLKEFDNIIELNKK